MIYKKIDDVTKEDIENLILNKVAEKKNIEYKLELPGGKDEDKREFLADVSSFANAVGGDIFYGIKAIDGCPIDAEGISCNSDKEIDRLRNIILQGLQPRLQGFQITSINGFKNGPIILVRILQSWNSPHMITFHNYSRFYTRNSNGKFQMDVADLKFAFLKSDTLSDKIAKFRDSRLSKIIAGEVPTPLVSNSYLVVHIVPFVSFSPGFSLEVKDMINYERVLRPICGESYGCRHNIDGFLTYSTSITGYSGCYTQLYRNGIIEIVDAHFVDKRKDANFIYASWEKRLIDRLNDILQFYRKFNVNMPYSIVITMINVRGCSLKFGGADTSLHQTTIERDTLNLPDIIYDEESQNLHSSMRPIFDAFWNACGYNRALSYDDAGKWKALS